jgi:hypothetical protein
MVCRGVFFALTADDERKLLAASSDDELVEVISEDIEERWDAEWLAEADKAWDAMHRCLGDGTLNPGDSVLSKCVLGGRQLYKGEDYFVSFLAALEVKDVAAALEGVEQAWFFARYESLSEGDYDGPHGAEDRDYTWESFVATRELFRKAAQGGRAMAFTVDQ